MGRPATLKVDIIADAKGVKGGVDDADSHFSRLGSIAGKAGAAVGVGMVVAATAVVGFAASSVGAASDLQQSMGAVETVFGKASGQVKAYADTSAEQLGLSKNSYAELAAVVGSQLQGMGVAQDASAGKTQDLIKTGADLAATFGGSVSDAVGAVSSLLKGESDPIERYGVSIKVSDVNARLAAEGLDKLQGAALKQATATATLQLLTEKTANAHGQFAKQTNTLAEQQQILAAKFDNVKASVGTALLPVITQLFTFASSTLLPGLKRVSDHLATQLGPTFAEVGGFVKRDVVPVLQNLGAFLTGKLLPAFVSFAGPILSALRGAFASISGAVEKHRDQLADIGTAVEKVIGVALKLAPVIGTVLGAAFRTTGAIIGGVVDVIALAVSAIEKAFDAIQKVAGAAKSVGSFVGGIGGHLGFSGGAALAPMAVQLVGGSPISPAGRQLATAGFGVNGGLTSLGLQYGGAGAVIVDRRSIDASVTVTGALDPVSVARQLQQLLGDQATRIGAVSSFGLA